MTKDTAKIFQIVDNTGIDTLREQALNEKNKDKQSLLMAMYEYELKQKQKEVINRKEFII